MTATLNQTQADLPRLVELASQGEDVLITVEGIPKARLTRAELAIRTNARTEVDIAAWIRDLDEARRKYATGNSGPSVEQILDEDRADRA